MSPLVDTHCHVQSIGQASGEKATRERWAKAKELTPDSVLKRAQAAGVTRLIVVGCDYNDSALAIDYASQREGTYASIGVHPHEAKLYHTEHSLEGLVRQSKVVAIGECGLDYYYNHSTKTEQIAVFKLQLELANRYKLPLIFHVRDAFADFWDIFSDYPRVKGVLHSFTDSLVNLEKGLNQGLYVGVNGIATFNKVESLNAVYKAIPLQNLLLETDAPFLTPAPYRGNINEPMRIGVIADHLAKLRGESRETLAEATTANALKLFRITS